MIYYYEAKEEEAFFDSYAACLRAAGAVVLDYHEFGDYQGEWFAHVIWNGRDGWVCGHFGSCFGCDVLQAAKAEKPFTRADAAEFGREYLEEIKTFDGLRRELRENYGSTAMLNYLEGDQNDT